MLTQKIPENAAQIGSGAAQIQPGVHMGSQRMKYKDSTTRLLHQVRKHFPTVSFFLKGIGLLKHIILGFTVYL